MSTFWTAVIAIVAYEIVKAIFRFAVGCAVAYLEWREELREEAEWKKREQQKSLDDEYR